MNKDVFSSPAWVRTAMLFNLGGALLLLFSYQATSSDVKISKYPDGTTVFCVGDKLLMTSLDTGEVALGGKSGCQDRNNALAHPISVVNVDKPYFVTVGLIATSIGFFLQFLSSFPKTTPQLREELRQSKLRDKLDDSHQSRKRLGP